MGRREEPEAAAPPAGPHGFAAQLRRLQVLSTRLVTGVLAGEYHSVFRGRGIEFDQVREYQPGDDVRAIDWNVTARAGRPFVKQFVEEREMTVLLLLDRSASLDCPTPRGTKSAVAAEACALLALAAGRCHDRLGLLTCSGRVERFIPPGKGAHHARQVVAALYDRQPAGEGTDLAGALEYLDRVARPGATLCVVSDFQAPPFGPHLAAVARRHDVVALLVSDPYDLELPVAGLIEVRDPESGRRRLVDTDARQVRDAYRDSARARRERLLETFAQAGVSWLELPADSHPLHPMVRFFRERRRRGRGQR